MYSTNLKALKFPVTLALALALLAAMLLIPPALAQWPGTTFSYQGSLSDGGSPVDDTCAFEFKLYDAETGGTQIGSTQTANSVTVSDGLFTVNLDFGVDAFTGPPRYLGIAVQCSGDSAYTTLSPRQPLHPTPYSMYATQAGTVVSDTVSSLNCTDGQVAKWNNTASQWECAADSGGASYTAGAGIEIVDEVISSTMPQPQNVIWVAKSGGDYTSIQAALDSITDASASNPYLIMVAPGVYTERVTMKQYVDIQGSGEGATIIKYTGDYFSENDSGTVIGADNAELRLLTVESDGTGNRFATAIYNDATSPSLLHVTATASGGSLRNNGVFNNNSAAPTMDDITAVASGGSQHAYGVYNEYSSPTMNNVTATASGSTGYNAGVYNQNVGTPILINVTATASGGTYSYGVYNQNASTTMNNVTATSSGGDSSYSVYNTSSAPTIRNSALSGATYSIYNSSATAMVATSMLSGTVTGGGFTCVGVYDGSFTALNTSCQ